MIRDEVRELVALGQFPGAEVAEEAVIARHEQALARIASPVSVDEARALLGCFGPDECFGLAWALVHIIESAPQLPLASEPEPDANEWIRMLWDRARRTMAQSGDIETWSDITDAFEVLQDSLVYVDAPVEGFVRRKLSGQIYAFRCRVVLAALVWHWILLPVDSVEASVEHTFRACDGRVIRGWYSVVEDRRGSAPGVTPILITPPRGLTCAAVAA